MDTKLYLTIAAIVAVLYALAFLVIPIQASMFFSGFAEPRASCICGSAGRQFWRGDLIVWFARDFHGWYAVRSVLIGSIVGLAVNIIIAVSALVQGWLNSNAWGSTAILVLLLVGAAYHLAVGGRKGT
jgi:hypothetical protein